MLIIEHNCEIIRNFVYGGQGSQSRLARDETPPLRRSTGGVGGRDGRGGLQFETDDTKNTPQHQRATAGAAVACMYFTIAGPRCTWVVPSWFVHAVVFVSDELPIAEILRMG